MVNYQDQIVLFGDSLTQMSWDPEIGGIGARLASTSVLIIVSNVALQRTQHGRFVCAQTRRSEPRVIRVQYRLGAASLETGM